MSFEPTTSIWAAKKAAEIVGESGALSASACALNLYSYGIDLFMAAGTGTLTVENTQPFWNEVTKAVISKTPLILVIDGSIYGTGIAYISAVQCEGNESEVNAINATWLQTFSGSSVNIAQFFFRLERISDGRTVVLVVMPTSATEVTP